MGRITAELLRRRAEHNEGCLSNLKEIALHQQDIEKIELIGDACRQLEIVYLCNNYIGKIEGLRHLKWLTYLNLAVNNITVIDGLQGCESLERLDLTLNFIADPTCVQTLLANACLASLHLTGNPCTKTEGYRAYVVHTLPQLKELDGDEVIRAERIAARQAEDDVIQVVEEEVVRVRETERIKQEMLARGIDPFPAKFNEKGERVYGHTPEERLQMLREQKEQEKKQKEAQAKASPGSITAIHQEIREQQQYPNCGRRLTAEEEKQKFGRLLLRNEGRVPFHLNQDGADAVVLTVEPGKFLSTTLLSVDVEVDVIRVSIKGKLLQVPVEEELAADAAQVQRSATTGQLKITVPYTAEVQERRGAGRARLQKLSWESAVPPNTKSNTCAGHKAEEKTKATDTGSSCTATTATMRTPMLAAAAPERSALLDIEKRMGDAGNSSPVDANVQRSTNTENNANSGSVVKLVEELPQGGAASPAGALKNHWDELD